MKILALSTSTKYLSAAVSSDGKVISYCQGDTSRKHAETVIPCIDGALNGCGLTVNDLDAIAVDVGPGSFTGVRIGVTAANAIAFACHIPVIQVSSLEAIRTQSGQIEDAFCALVDALNGNAYAAVWVNGENTIPPSAVELDGLLAALPENCTVAGDIADTCGTVALADAKGIAACALQKGPADYSKEARPMYLRPSQAERKAAEAKK